MPAKPKKRIASTHPAPQSIADFEAQINATAALQLTLESAKAQLNELLSQTGAELREEIDRLEADIKARLDALHGYAHTHREQIFPRGKKTAETTQATFGFADNPARFTFAQDYSEEDSISALLKLGKAQFVRTVREVNKDAIKEALRTAAEMETAPDRPADWQPAITLPDLRMCGLKLSQTERFWLEPRRATAPGENTITV